VQYQVVPASTEDRASGEDVETQRGWLFSWDLSLGAHHLVDELFSIM
jgi:hypothetical protein